MPTTRRFDTLAVAAIALAGLAGLTGCSGSSEVSPGECSESSADALRVCEVGATTRGVDVSAYQGTVRWARVKASGHAFGIARASDGLHHSDATFAGNWRGMKRAGVVRGAYQFFRPEQDPIAQANLLLSKLSAAGGLHAGDLAPVLDIEVTDGVSPATIRTRAKTWLSHVQQRTGRKPIVYTGAFMSGVIGTSLRAYPLWVANYGASCPDVPSGWSRWRMWQYASNASVSGISGETDVNKFHGTLAQLKAFAGASATRVASLGTAEHFEPIASDIGDEESAPTNEDLAGDVKSANLGAGEGATAAADEAAPIGDDTGDGRIEEAASTLPSDHAGNGPDSDATSGSVMGDGSRVSAASAASDTGAGSGGGCRSR